MGAVSMNIFEQIKNFFQGPDGDASPWIVKAVPGVNPNMANVWCGAEFLGLVWCEFDGQWLCMKDDITGRPATNIMNAVANHIGSGVQNTLTTASRVEMRKVMIRYFETSIAAKAPKA